MIDFRLRRTRWMVGGAVAVVVAVLVGWGNSRRCEVVVHNFSAEPRAGVMVTAAGFRWAVEALPPDGSRARKVDPGLAGSTWTVHRGQAGEAVQEVWFEPGPGRRLILRIWHDGLVEPDVRPAWWE